MGKLSKLFPRSSTDKFAFCFSLSGIHAVFIMELFYVLPWIVTNREDYSPIVWYIHVGMALFLYINTMANFWMTIKADSSTRNVVLPSILKPEWRYCSFCECNAPPRSFHCHTCNICIMKRDHHCPFTGNCIGHTNHRYYLLLIFYCWAAAVYANVMNIEYIGYIIGELSIGSVLSLVFPFFSWIIRRIDFVTMVTSALLLLCIAVCCALTALLGYHLGNVYKGQLTYERSNGIKKYNIGWRNNFVAVFGERWMYAWIFPAVASPLPSNGLEFPVAGVYENPKEM